MVLIVETFGAGAWLSREIIEGLELPVCPAGEVFISDITDLSNLLSTRFFADASTELCYDKRDTKFGSIFCSLFETILVIL